MDQLPLGSALQAQEQARQAERDQRTLDEPRQIPQPLNLPAHLAQAYAALPPLIPLHHAIPQPAPIPACGRGRGRGRGRSLPPLPALNQFQNLPAHLAQQIAALHAPQPM
ncbi:hypothetical protein C0991_006281, partial [Blastosporella zonata]